MRLLEGHSATNPPRRVAPAGWVILAAGIILAVSRITIEALRVSDAASEDRLYALTLLWSTALSLFATAAFVMALFFASNLPVMQRSRFLAAARPGCQQFEAGRETGLMPALRDLGAPEQLSRPSAWNHFFTVVVVRGGLEFWIGGRQPHCVWQIPWSAVVSVSQGQIARSWKLFRSLDVTVKFPDRAERVVQLSMAAPRLPQPRPLSNAEIHELLSAIRSHGGLS